MKRLFLGSLAMCAAMVAATSFAAPKKETITIKFYGEEYQGQETINLKRLLKDESDGDLKLAKYKLEEVRVFAKSEHGQGKLELITDGYLADRANVPGRARDFYDDDASTYFKIKLDGDEASLKDELKLKLKGHIRILKIVLVLEKASSGRDDDCIVQVGDICISDDDGERCVRVGDNIVCTGGSDRDDDWDRPRDDRDDHGSSQSNSQSTVCVNGHCVVTRD